MSKTLLYLLSTAILGIWLLGFRAVSVSAQSLPACSPTTQCSQFNVRGSSSCLSVSNATLNCCPEGQSIAADYSCTLNTGGFPQCPTGAECGVLRGGINFSPRIQRCLSGQMLAMCCPVGERMSSDGSRCSGDAEIGTEVTPESTLTETTLDSFNPLKQNSAGVEEDLTSPGGIVTRFLRFAFPIAGLILFVMLIWSGFEILSGSAERKSLDAGKQRATAAVIGFLLLFVSYWLAQIIGVIFGVQIL